MISTSQQQQQQQSQSSPRIRSSSRFSSSSFRNQTSSKDQPSNSNGPKFTLTPEDSSISSEITLEGLNSLSLTTTSSSSSKRRNISNQDTSSSSSSNLFVPTIDGRGRIIPKRTSSISSSSSSSSSSSNGISTLHIPKRAESKSLPLNSSRRVPSQSPTSLRSMTLKTAQAHFVSISNEHQVEIQGLGLSNHHLIPQNVVIDSSDEEDSEVEDERKITFGSPKLNGSPKLGSSKLNGSPKLGSNSRRLPSSIRHHVRGGCWNSHSLNSNIKIENPLMEIAQRSFNRTWNGQTQYQDEMQEEKKNQSSNLILNKDNDSESNLFSSFSETEESTESSEESSFESFGNLSLSSDEEDEEDESDKEEENLFKSFKRSESNLSKLSTDSNESLNSNSSVSSTSTYQTSIHESEEEDKESEVKEVEVLKSLSEVLDLSNKEQETNKVYESDSENSLYKGFTNSIFSSSEEELDSEEEEELKNQISFPNKPFYGIYSYEEDQITSNSQTLIPSNEIFTSLRRNSSLEYHSKSKFHHSRLLNKKSKSKSKSSSVSYSSDSDESFSSSSSSSSFSGAEDWDFDNLHSSQEDEDEDEEFETIILGIGNINDEISQPLSTNLVKPNPRPTSIAEMQSKINLPVIVAPKNVVDKLLARRISA